MRTASIRTSFLCAAAGLMIFGATANALVIVPDLHGDLVEIGVRRSVLGGVVLALHFEVLTQFGMAAIVSAAAIQSARGSAPARIPLAIIATIYAVFSIMAFSRSHNPHHLGPLLMAVLIAIGLAIPARD